MYHNNNNNNTENYPNGQFAKAAGLIGIESVDDKKFRKKRNDAPGK